MFSNKPQRKSWLRVGAAAMALSLLTWLTPATAITIGPAWNVTLTGSASENAAGLITYNLTLQYEADGDGGDISPAIYATLPSGVSFVITGSNSGCFISGQSLECDLPDLATGNGVTVSESATVVLQASNPAASVSVTYTIPPDPSETNQNDNTVTLTTSVPGVDLSLTGSGTEDSTGLATDTLTLKNAGPLTATGVTVTTTLPSVVTLATGSSSGCTANGTAVTCTVAGLAANGTATVVVMAQAPSHRLTLALTFNASAAQPDANPANNSVTVTTQDNAVIDIALTGSGTETLGGLATDTLTLSNNGPAGATSAKVTTTLPSGVSFVSASSSSGCTGSGQSVTCTIGSVAANASAIVTVAAQDSSANTTLSLTFAAQASQADDNSANNTVTITTDRGGADLALSGVGSETLSGLAIDNLTVLNQGPGDDTNVVITGTLPSGAGFVSASSSAGCAASGQAVTCTVGSLAANATATVKVAVQAPATQASLSVPYSVTGAQTDPDTSNNSATVTTNTTYLSYQYDGNGFISKRAPTTGGATYVLYNKAGQLIGEYDSSGTAQRENVYMGHAVVAYSNAGIAKDGSCTPTGTSTPTYTVTDPLGSPVAASDACGGMMWTQPYYPFGNRQSFPALGQNDQWYTGKYQDDLTQLVDMGERQYSPAFGRFMSIDPASVSPANFHSFNRYEYGNNNPYRYVDPNGASPSPVDLLNFAVDVGSLLVDEGVYAAAEVNGNEAVAGMAVEAIEGDRFDAAASTFGVIDPIPGTGQAVKAAHVAEEAEKAAIVTGRAGKQARLRELADDADLGSADRGWLKQEINSIERGQRDTIRVPPGKQLAHERGREAAKGYDYDHSNLQDTDLHKLQHKYDDGGRANTERPPTTGDSE